jgi:hypothetical protein
MVLGHSFRGDKVGQVSSLDTTAVGYASTSVIKVEMDPQERDSKNAAKLRPRVLATVSEVQNQQKRQRGSMKLS